MNNVEEIVKHTLREYALSYKMARDMQQKSRTDYEAERFILGAVPNLYHKMLSYYDFLKVQK